MSRLVKSAEEHINTLVVKQQTAGSPQSPAAAITAADGSEMLSAGTDVTAATAAAAGEPAPAAAIVVAEEAQPLLAAAAEEVDHDAAANDVATVSSADAEQQHKLPVDTAVFARTRMALQTWDTLCNNASTPSTVLPAGSSELVRQLQVREKWAKLVGVPHGDTEAAPEAADEQDDAEQQEGDSAAGGRKQQRQENEEESDEQEAAAASKKQRC